ncbi:MAG TPA: hypothetical protein DD490_25500 [Acidobacteria bacterium]|nr:hypothetical protein [Acidobacteriota bacterium]
MRFCLLLLAWLAPPLAAQEPPSAPPVVASIEIRSETALGEEALGELQDLLALVPGAPLTDAAVARTLRNVQASGLASEVEIYTRPAEDGAGVVALLVLRPVVRVREVRLEGHLDIEEAELRRQIPQNPAEPLNEEKVVRGVFQLQDLYAERGYFTATARVRVETDPRTRQAVVLYHVESGRRSKVGGVELRGPLGPFQAADLLPRLDLPVGEGFSQRRARDAAERLQTWLVRQGYRNARVDKPETATDPQTGAVRLVFPLEVGPRLELRVIGADEAQLRRKDLLPFLNDQGFDEALVLQSLQRIKDFYQRQGHYRVKVEDRIEEKDGVRTLTLRIDPGPVYTLRGVDFTGNTAFSGDRLAEHMTTAGRRLLNLGSGRLVDGELEPDLENLRSYYALQGYGQARVGPARVIEEGSGLRLEIPVVEGPRQLVAGLRFEGVESLDPGTLGATLPLRLGGPFHPFLLEQTLDVLRLAYRDKGYAEAQVSAGVAWNADPSLADVTLRVFEGERMILDRVIVRGNQRTESAVIRRTLAVEPGSPISETRRLEIERDLYRLGIFSSVQVELSRAGTESAARDLLVRVEEGRPRRVSYSLGLEYGSADATTLRPRGGFSFVHSNLAGKAYSLRADLRASELDQSLRVLFDQPYVGRHPVPLTWSVFFFNEDKESWNVVRRGGRVEAVKALADRRVALAYDYRRVETTVDPGFGLSNVDREDRPYDLSSLIPSFLWDRRNDPVLATRGWSALAQLQWAFPALSTDGDFLKLFVQQTQYVGLDRFGVLAASLRAGGIEPFSHLDGNDPDLHDTLPNADVFIDERFFAGGPTSHRAYGRDDLGLLGQTLIRRDTTTGPKVAGVGGNGLLLLNLEYRFPIAGAFEGVAFYDAGNVWADWRRMDLQDVRSGAGGGLRWLSPIGPLRFDVAWKLDRQPYEDSAPVFSLSYGNPF